MTLLDAVLELTADAEALSVGDVDAVALVVLLNTDVDEALADPDGVALAARV